MTNPEYRALQAAVDALAGRLEEHPRPEIACPRCGADVYWRLRSGGHEVKVRCQCGLAVEARAP